MDNDIWFLFYVMSHFLHISVLFTATTGKKVDSKAAGYRMTLFIADSLVNFSCSDRQSWQESVFLLKTISILLVHDKLIFLSITRRAVVSTVSYLTGLNP